MSIQIIDTFCAIGSGFKYLPASLAVQAVIVTAASLAGIFPRKTIIEAWFLDRGRLDLKMTGKQLVVGAAAGLIEETYYRGIMQDGYLTRAPRMFLSLFGKEDWADATIAKVVRSVISAVAFSEMHKQNQVVLTKDLMNYQVANALGLGLVAAAVKEQTGSMWPAVGLHIFHNIIAISILALIQIKRGIQR